MKTSIQLHFLLFFLVLAFTLSSSITHDHILCLESEKQALLEFKESLTDPHGRLSSWRGKDCCTWTGISCSNKTRHVVKIDLGKRHLLGSDEIDIYKARQQLGVEMNLHRKPQQLGGEINHSLLQLKHLQHLDLSFINFTGSVLPTFISSLPRLKYLDLSNTCFNGPVPLSWGNLSSLYYLDLCMGPKECAPDDNLEVDNLHWLSGLSSLKYLNMSGNNLSTAPSNWLQHVNMLPSLLELRLSSCELSHLPVSIPVLNFTLLTTLDLSGNYFGSSIPQWLFNLTNLAILDLSMNNFQGPIPNTFTNMTSLQHLDMSYNYHLNGKMPSSLVTLCKLVSLDLSANNIKGEITAFLDGLSACPVKSDLKHLILHSNQMNGTIPKSLGKLSDLERLILRNNSWEGVISKAHFFSLTRLKLLSFSSTLRSSSLKLDVSMEWIPPFSKLEVLHLENCQVGPLFPSWIRSLKHISRLTLKHAKISDSLPKWFQGSKQYWTLDLSNNQIIGKFPFEIHRECSNSFSSKHNITSYPPNMIYSFMQLVLTNNSFAGPIPLNIGKTMPWLEALDLSNNFMSGDIPSSICKLKNLLTVTLSSNHFTGELPKCSWKNLFYLDTGDNNLTGKIPNEIGLSPFLSILKLSNNSLYGQIPPSFRELTNLAVLDLGENSLSGEIPIWMGKGMILLRLRSNLFSGPIPPQLCNFSSLQFLDLGNNKLSGTIPSCVANLSSMTTVGLKNGGVLSILNGGSLSVLLNLGHLNLKVMVLKGIELPYSSNLKYLKMIDISANNLSGVLPSGLTKLIGLGILNLSINHLTGVIPRQIGNLKQLESLDLSRNHLSGMIPPTIPELTFLSHFNLSNNNLCGRIPSGNQLQTLNDSTIYQGNSQLCGPPLTNKCPGDEVNPGPIPVASDENGSTDEMFWFYIGMGSGFVVGLMGVCGTLLWSRSLSRAYFQFIGEIKDQICLVIAIRITRLQRAPAA